jgi:hypothetical protein
LVDRGLVFKEKDSIGGVWEDLDILIMSRLRTPDRLLLR